MPSEYELSVHLQSALSVAHDFVDAIARIKCDLKITQDTLDANAVNYSKIVAERDRQIDALTNECIKKDEEYRTLRDNSNFYQQAEATQAARLEQMQGRINDLIAEKTAHEKSIRELKEALKLSEVGIHKYQMIIENLQEENDRFKQPLISSTDVPNLKPKKKKIVNGE